MKTIAAAVLALGLALSLVESCGGSVQGASGSVGSDASSGGGSSSGSASGGTPDATASCGALEAACCNGTACNAGLVCLGGTCAPSASSGGSSSSGSGAGSGSSSGSSGTGGAPVDSALDLETSTPLGPSCKGGSYVGPITGNYTSHLTTVGLSVPAAGQVRLVLEQAGGTTMTCTIEGESEDCSNVFLVQSGTIAGTLNATSTDAGQVGGFPFFCTVTGTLNCPARKLIDGWMECTYCVGPLNDGGTSCALGSGGQFAGVMTATYDGQAFAFTNGTWNGAEALGGNNGSTPGPDGGPPASYLSDSGIYEGPGQYGGSGTWGATFQ
jgi:hypothetical protein